MLHMMLGNVSVKQQQHTHSIVCNSGFTVFLVMLLYLTYSECMHVFCYCSTA